MTPAPPPALSRAERSLRAFPDGSNGEFGLPEELTMVLARGNGCRLWDSDGREFLDMSMGWGSVLPGHANPRMVEAVTHASASGTNFAYTNEASLELAERLIALSPCCDQVRFCASGTEATMYCLRLARAFTRKPSILRFEGAYHGSHDVGVTSLFPSGRTPFPTPEPSSAGIDASATLVAPYNDLDTTISLLREHADAIGGVIIEPFQRCLSPVPGFLEGLREETAALDIPLIFDEVVTGFRFGLGGAQAYYGVVPDLVAYGKALGGGMPIGAFGGRRDIMALVRESQMDDPQYVWTASSLGGNPVSCHAALAALAIYEQPGFYERMFRFGEEARDGLRRLMVDRGESSTILGDGPLCQLAFTDHPVTDYRSWRLADRQRGRAFMLGLVSEGVFVNPMGTKLYLSLAHQSSDLHAFFDRCGRALDSMK